MPDALKSDHAATPRLERLTAGLVATLDEFGPSPAAVELYEIVADRVDELRAAGRGSGDVVNELRIFARTVLTPLATTFPLQRAAQLIIGDVTRWVLHEYFRPRRTMARSNGGRGVTS